MKKSTGLAHVTPCYKKQKDSSVLLPPPEEIDKDFSSLLFKKKILLHAPAMHPTAQIFAKQKGGFSCSYCSEHPPFLSFPDQRHAEQHLETVHRPQEKEACTICDRMFPTGEGAPHVWREHIESQAIRSLRSMLRLEFCSPEVGTKTDDPIQSGLVRRTKPLAKASVVKVEGEKPYKCSACDYHGKKTSNVTAHISSIHGKVLELCTRCNKWYARERGGIKHAFAVHRDILGLPPQSTTDTKESKKPTLNPS